jgi:DNA-binding transcriptional MerR regulator
VKVKCVLPDMRIGTVQRRTGVRPRLLRYYYEEQGLLRPRRLRNGYREYSESDIAVVGHIRALLAAGVGTAAIADLLPCLGRRPACPQLVAGLRRERGRITGAIARLQNSRRALELLLDDISAPGVLQPARHGGPVTCAQRANPRQPEHVGRQGHALLLSSGPDSRHRCVRR